MFTSLRAKLILVVLLISLTGLSAMVYSSLVIIRESQRETAQASDRQVSTLVSKSLLSQVSDYQQRLEYIFNSWQKNGAVNIERELLPDFVWIQFLDFQGKTLFEWRDQQRLDEGGLHPEMLIGYKKKEEFVQEVKIQPTDRRPWVVFNSTIQTLFPTLLMGTKFKKDGEAEERTVVLAEIHAERLFSRIQSQAHETLMLIDAHDNVLLSTKPGWDPSDIVLTDEVLAKELTSMKEGETHYTILNDKDRGEQSASIFKFHEGGGLSLVLQESTASLHSGERKITTYSIAIAFAILIFAFNLLMLFGNMITSPIIQLMHLMEKAGKGEFTGKIKVRSKDEIGKLAAIFNKMMTDLKQREEEIERAKSRLIQSEKMSAFGQMSAGIAHEVKNPLAGILGYAQMTKKKLPPDSDIVSYIDIIEKETVRCKEIVENLMKFARQEKAMMSRIDINKTIKDSIRLVEHQISISGIKLVQVFALEGAPIWVKGNANQIQQVMMNLMLNAQQAMENKGSLTVSTHYTPETGRVLIIVSDTGMGMTEETKARIFEPFFTTKGVGKGTGLGLSVSIGIIKDHGGSIDVESEVSKGTTFTISLPVETQTGEGEKSSQAAA